MPSFKRPIGASGVLLSLALVAGACASDSPDATEAGADTSSAETAAQSETTAAAASDTSSDTQAADGGAEPEPEIEGPSPIGPHSFPDLDTVTISDGATVNLADELAGGDTPILLWFFAPH